MPGAVNGTGLTCGGHERQAVLQRFAAQHELWVAGLAQAAQLDALMSLAVAARLGCAHGPVCRPRIVSGADARQVRLCSGQKLANTAQRRSGSVSVKM